MDEFLFGLTLFAALGAGIMAGIFYAFSTFVMKALDRIPDPEGIRAMQSINVAVITPLFVLAFMGTLAASIGLIIAAIARIPDEPGWLWLAGGLLYVVGDFLMTGRYHQPRNLALGRLDADSAEAADMWARYVPGWTTWNHVRTLAALGASACYTLALLDL
jgi:uncharacterized membrane protein